VASALSAGALEPVAPPLCAHLDIARLVVARLGGSALRRAA